MSDLFRALDSNSDGYVSRPEADAGLRRLDYRPEATRRPPPIGGSGAGLFGSSPQRNISTLSSVADDQLDEMDQKLDVINKQQAECQSAQIRVLSEQIKTLSRELWDMKKVLEQAGVVDLRETFAKEQEAHHARVQQLLDHHSAKQDKLHSKLDDHKDEHEKRINGILNDHGAMKDFVQGHAETMKNDTTAMKNDLYASLDKALKDHQTRMGDVHDNVSRDMEKRYGDVLSRHKAEQETQFVSLFERFERHQSEVTVHHQTSGESLREVRAVVDQLVHQSERIKSIFTGGGPAGTMSANGLNRY